MKRTVLPTFMLVVIARTCPATIVVPTREPEHLTRLYNATIDILMTCYGDAGNTVGVIGDSDGSILKALWSNYLIPAVSVDTAMTTDNSLSFERRHKVQVFVIANTSTKRFEELFIKLIDSIWWTHYANFLIVHSMPDIVQQCSNVHPYLYALFNILGVLRAQFICIDGAMNVHIFDSNPFTHKAPEPWQFVKSYETESMPISLFKRIYQEGGKTCDALNFDKTNDLGGYPLQIEMPSLVINYLRGEYNVSIVRRISYIRKKMLDVILQEHKWFVDNIVIGMNASTALCKDSNETSIVGIPFPRSVNQSVVYQRLIHSTYQVAFIAVTQHTAHKSQLEKILSVIDRESRIGMCIVYLITFLFFKFFLRLSVTSALLNLIRLTCNAGLPRLPQNLESKIYLACLFVFVVTLQGIYTGDLASLLTKTVAHRHVNKIEDIRDLGYKIYVQKVYAGILKTIPLFDGQVITVVEDDCIKFVLSDPLIVCIVEYKDAVFNAYLHKLHLSRDTIKNDFTYYLLSNFNPLGQKLQARISTWDECGLRPGEGFFRKIHSGAVNDDEVNNNVVRRVMTMDDLRFAFVTLAIGLTCSFVCFIGEIITRRISLRIAKRRNRVRPRSAWGSDENKCLSFSTLKFSFFQATV